MKPVHAVDRLQTEKENLLVDCGLFQGYKQPRLRNWSPLPFDVRTLDAVVLTHAHPDHTGYLPLLLRNGYAGPVYCTEATYDLDDPVPVGDDGQHAAVEASDAKPFGALTLAASFAAYVFYARWFIAVWCFFAAGLSLVILVHFTANNPAPISGACTTMRHTGRRKQYHPSLMGAS